MNSADRERALETIDCYAKQGLANGFMTNEEIVDLCIDLAADETDIEPKELEHLAAERVKSFSDQHVLVEASWVGETDCDRLDRVFADLEAAGIICRQNFSCCGNCGSGEILDEMEAAREEGRLVRGYVFYHSQDTDAACDGHGVYLAFGSYERSKKGALLIASEVSEALRQNGFNVEWEGTISKRILVNLEWKRRRVARVVSKTSRRPLKPREGFLGRIVRRIFKNS